jgi:hypothetical protein
LQPELDLTVETLQAMPCFSQDVHLFFSCFEKFSNNNDVAKEFRRKEWGAIDGNGSGHVSR